MKKTNVIYWIFTGLFAAFMLFSSISNVQVSEEAVAFFASLGYPKYLVIFLGIAKVLGVIVILIPGFPRLKEWAYAGLFFDLLGATYSVMSVFPITAQTLFMVLPFTLEALSYIYYHKRLKESQ